MAESFWLPGDSIGMSTNVGNADRIARVVASFVLVAVAVIAPVPLLAQIGLGIAALYMLGTAVAGTCLGYKMMGKSTCPTRAMR